MVALTTLAGCGSEPSESRRTRDSVNEPGYLIHSAVSSPDGRTNYFTRVASLAEERELGYGGSLEVPGRARLYAQPGGSLFIGDSEDVSLTRYTLSDAGDFEAGESLSFQHLGVQTLGAQAVLFVGETKAYYKDSGQGLIIVWNPRDMVIEDVIELPANLLREDHVLGVSDWVSRDGEAFFAVSWYTREYDQVLPGTALIRVDTDADEITVLEDDRCRGLKTAGHVGDDLYFFSDVINGFGHHVYPDEGGQQDCVLRVRAGETELDPDYLGSLSDVLPEGMAAAAMALTAEGEVWAQVVDLETAPSEPGAAYGEWYGADWTWWRIALDEGAPDEAVQIEGEPGAYSGFTLAAGEHFFIAQTAADYSETTLMDLHDGAPKPGISFAGFTLDVARID